VQTLVIAQTRQGTAELQTVFTRFMAVMCANFGIPSMDTVQSDSLHPCQQTPPPTQFQLPVRSLLSHFVQAEMPPVSINQTVPSNQPDADVSPGMLNHDLKKRLPILDFHPVPPATTLDNQCEANALDRQDPFQSDCCSSTSSVVGCYIEYANLPDSEISQVNALSEVELIKSCHAVETASSESTSSAADVLMVCQSVPVVHPSTDKPLHAFVYTETVLAALSKAVAMSGTMHAGGAFPVVCCADETMPDPPWQNQEVPSALLLPEAGTTVVTHVPLLSDDVVSNSGSTFDEPVCCASVPEFTHVLHNGPAMATLVHSGAQGPITIPVKVLTTAQEASSASVTPVSEGVCLHEISTDSSASSLPSSGLACASSYVLPNVDAPCITSCANAEKTVLQIHDAACPSVDQMDEADEDSDVIDEFQIFKESHEEDFFNDNSEDAVDQHLVEEPDFLHAKPVSEATLQEAFLLDTEETSADGAIRAATDAPPDESSFNSILHEQPLGSTARQTVATIGHDCDHNGGSLLWDIINNNDSDDDVSYDEPGVSEMDTETAEISSSQKRSRSPDSKEAAPRKRRHGLSNGGDTPPRPRDEFPVRDLKHPGKSSRSGRSSPTRKGGIPDSELSPNYDELSLPPATSTAWSHDRLFPLESSEHADAKKQVFLDLFADSFGVGGAHAGAKLARNATSPNPLTRDDCFRGLMPTAYLEKMLHSGSARNLDFVVTPKYDGVHIFVLVTSEGVFMKHHIHGIFEMYTCASSEESSEPDVYATYKQSLQRHATAQRSTTATPTPPGSAAIADAHETLFECELIFDLLSKTWIVVPVDVLVFCGKPQGTVLFAHRMDLVSRMVADVNSVNALCSFRFQSKPIVSARDMTDKLLPGAMFAHIEKGGRLRVDVVRSDTSIPLSAHSFGRTGTSERPRAAGALEKEQVVSHRAGRGVRSSESASSSRDSSRRDHVDVALDLQRMQTNTPLFRSEGHVVEYDGFIIILNQTGYHQSMKWKYVLTVDMGVARMPPVELCAQQRCSVDLFAMSNMAPGSEDDSSGLYVPVRAGRTTIDPSTSHSSLRLWKDVRSLLGRRSSAPEASGVVVVEMYLNLTKNILEPVKIRLDKIKPNDIHVVMDTMAKSQSPVSLVSLVTALKSVPHSAINRPRVPPRDSMLSGQSTQSYRKLRHSERGGRLPPPYQRSFATNQSSRVRSSVHSSVSSSFPSNSGHHRHGPDRTPVSLLPAPLNAHSTDCNATRLSHDRGGGRKRVFASGANLTVLGSSKRGSSFRRK
jgi:hypothetical protein